MAKKRIIGNPTTTPYNPNKIAITVDSELSTTSKNPVQNKVIAEALKGKLDGYIHGNQFDIDNYTTAGRYYIQAAHPSYPSYHLFVVARPIMGCTQYKIGAYGDISTRTWKGLTNTDDGSNIWTDWEDVVFSSDIENLVPFVVEATLVKGDMPNYVEYQYLIESETDGTALKNAYETGKKIVLKLIKEDGTIEYITNYRWFYSDGINWAKIEWYAATEETHIVVKYFYEKNVWKATVTPLSSTYVVEATLTSSIKIENADVNTYDELNNFAVNYDLIVLKLTEQSSRDNLTFLMTKRYAHTNRIEWESFRESNHYFIWLDNEGWHITVRQMLTKNDLDTAIGDIETSLDNIIEDYGIGGDSV